MKKTIEEIILLEDERGISKLKQFLPENFCSLAAERILNNKGIVFITTGFYIVSAQSPETDGPPGAIAIGNALEKLGYKVFYVVDLFCYYFFEKLVEPTKVILFPDATEKDTDIFAKRLLDKLKPSVLISIERCGLNADGKYLNMKGIDISEYNAKIDYLFKNHNNTIGIGDGGNEIGMGNLAEEIIKVTKLPNNPCITKVNDLIISSISNWGAYGLVAELSIKTEKNLLPSIIDERALLEKIVKCGAVDGITGKNELSVDGVKIDEYLKILRLLRCENIS